MPRQPAVVQRVGEARTSSRVVRDPGTGSQGVRGAAAAAGVAAEAGRQRQAFGRELVQIGDQLWDMHEAQEKAKAAIEHAKAKALIEGRYQEWYFERSQDPRAHETLEADARAKLKELAETAREGVTTSLAKQRLAVDVIEYSSQRVLEAKKDSRKQFITTAVADLDDLTTIARRDAAAAGTPEDLNTAMASHMLLLDEMYQSGIIDAKQHQDRREAFASGVTEDRVRASIRDNPTQMLQELADPNQHKWLDPSTRNRMVDMAQRAHDSQQRDKDMRLRRAEMNQERAVRRRSTQLFTELMLRGQELTTYDVEQAVASGLEGSQAVTALRRAESNANDNTDKKDYLSAIAGMLAEGTLTLDHLNTAFEKGGISAATRDRYTSSVLRDEYNVTNTPRYRSAMDILMTELGVFSGVAPVLGPSIIAEAKAELVERAMAGEDPMTIINGDPSDPKSPGLRKRYRLEGLEATPLPRFATEEEALRSGLSDREIGRQIRFIRARKAAGQ